ncbi:hypothetical protein FLX56_03470 [Synechococcus moorigangaii CMS01]|uniref:hypothetical protein n=1 Tax=Glycocaulis albus TaxID=1382801 RepID=UPI0016660295|nr:hypothetical protein [Glycocaulis albus]MBV5257481.1 hypothetical protein [Synechococcus moorigangaii CMS01]
MALIWHDSDEGRVSVVLCETLPAANGRRKRERAPATFRGTWQRGLPPATTGGCVAEPEKFWVPAFAGMTRVR